MNIEQCNHSSDKLRDVIDFYANRSLPEEAAEILRAAVEELERQRDGIEGHIKAVETEHARKKDLGSRPENIQIIRLDLEKEEVVYKLRWDDGGYEPRRVIDLADIPEDPEEGRLDYDYNGGRESIDEFIKKEMG